MLSEEADCCRMALVGCRDDGFFYATKLPNSRPARAQILDNPHHYRLLPYEQQDDRVRKCRTTLKGNPPSTPILVTIDRVDVLRIPHHGRLRALPVSLRLGSVDSGF